MNRFRIFIIAIASLVACSGIAFAAQDVPTLRYKVEIGPDGQPVVAKIVDDESVPAKGIIEQYSSGAPDADFNKNYWVVMNSKGNVVAAAPAGTTGLAEMMGQGDTMQVVDGGKFVTAGFWGRGQSFDEMQSAIKEQVRVAAKAFKEEACAMMKDWDEVKFTFEIGANAVVVAKIIAEGSFTPSKVC